MPSEFLWASPGGGIILRRGLLQLAVFYFRHFNHLYCTSMPAPTLLQQLLLGSGNCPLQYQPYRDS